MDNWTNILTTKTAARAEIARGILEQNGINAVLMDKIDNYSNHFGYVEVRVPTENAEAAKTILANEITPE
ncbi:DUF2007 domain-containing protein [Persicitalea sp.]|uniref:putative signal transducing protein n=1 Tax=Persicitalea sp. TaxID=3100273 RepID=UPI0035946E38